MYPVRTSPATRSLRALTRRPRPRSGSEGWLDRENLLEGVDQAVAYSVDIERSGGRFDNAPEVREAPLRVTHLFRREEGRWRIVHRHADFLQPRQEPR